mmetsp:Transcript_5922/g.11198  ORF Transcript_5922/g.11198 Transcript_5922/m.11198 type:complete len:200 (-) Transcript_5922:1623-2222(-)
MPLKEKHGDSSGGDEEGKDELGHRRNSKCARCSSIIAQDGRIVPNPWGRRIGTIIAIISGHIGYHLGATRGGRFGRAGSISRRLRSLIRGGSGSGSSDVDSLDRSTGRSRRRGWRSSHTPNPGTFGTNQADAARRGAVGVGSAARLGSSTLGGAVVRIDVFLPGGGIIIGGNDWFSRCRLINVQHRRCGEDVFPRFGIA